MKRLLTLALAAILALCLAACGSGSQPEETQATVSATTTAATTTTAKATTADPSHIYEIQLYLAGPEETADFRPIFITTTALTDGTPEHIVSLLMSEDYGSVLSFELDGQGGATLHMNAVYAHTRGSMGTYGEIRCLGSLVNTFLTFYVLDSILITAEGENTGHFDYREPFTFISYD